MCQFSRITSEPKNPVEKAVKEAMHRAYWDILREDMTKDPPDYSHAVKLVLEIKEVRFLSVIVVGNAESSDASSCSTQKRNRVSH